MLLKPTNPVKPANAEPRRLSSQDLFGSATRVHIEHRGCAYLLQITRQGKLILTK